MPDKPKYNNGFLPTLSLNAIATNVIKKLIKPIKIVINNTSLLELKPAILKIVGE